MGVEGVKGFKVQGFTAWGIGFRGEGPWGVWGDLGLRVHGFWAQCFVFWGFWGVRG